MASTLVSAAVLVMGFFICTVRAQLPQLPQGCNTQVAVLFPCLGFVQGQSNNPSQACCNALGGVVKNSPLCLCALVAAGPGNNAGVNTTLALTLPSRCNMKGLDPSQSCKGIGGSSSAPSAVQPQSAQRPSQAPSPAPSALQQSAQTPSQAPSPAPSALQQSAQTPSQAPSPAPSALQQSAQTPSQASNSGAASALPPPGSNGEQHMAAAQSPAASSTALLGFSFNWKMLSFAAALAAI